MYPIPGYMCRHEACVILLFSGLSKLCKWATPGAGVGAHIQRNIERRALVGSLRRATLRALGHLWARFSPFNGLHTHDVSVVQDSGVPFVNNDVHPP